MLKLWSPSDYVQENSEHGVLIGAWSPRRGEACNGPWTIGAIPLSNIIEDQEEETCSGGYTRTIIRIGVEDGTSFDLSNSELQPISPG